MAKTIISISQFHRDVFDLLGRAHRATLTTAQRMNELLIKAYGKAQVTRGMDGVEHVNGGPTFEQYGADQAALREIAAQRKLKDAQWLRKSYAKAVRTLYGALPVSMDAAAVLKRTQRAAAEANKRAAANNPEAPKAGAPAGLPQDHAPSPSETMEQLVTRLGLFNCGFALVRILEADEATKGNAVHIRKMLEAAQTAHVRAHNPSAETTKVRVIKATKDAKRSGNGATAQTGAMDAVGTAMMQAAAA